MRNELLHAYLIHYRKYREKSYIIHTFSEEHGRVDGILRQTPPPQYQLLQLQATGKNELKNFSHLELSKLPTFLTGDAFFVGFYLNELILRLCPAEQEMKATFLQYQMSLEGLRLLSQSHQQDIDLRQILRQFEYVLLQDLGYLVDFGQDFKFEPILEHIHYSFNLNEGFVPSMPNNQTFAGSQIMTMQNYDDGLFNIEQLNFLSRLYRQILNSLLGEKPLRSRQLWIQHKQK